MASGDATAPSKSLNGPSYRGFMHVKPSSDLSIGQAIGSQFSHLKYHNVGEFCHSIFRAAMRRINSTTLCVHVSYVIQGITQKKMVRVATSWVVAFMKDMDIGRDFLDIKVNFHCDSMSKGETNRWGASHDSSVSMTIYGSSPFQTITDALQFRIKPELKRFFRSSHYRSLAHG